MLNADAGASAVECGSVVVVLGVDVVVVFNDIDDGEDGVVDDVGDEGGDDGNDVEGEGGKTAD